MRPTSETDAETMRDEYDHVDSDFGPFAPSDTVPADFARKLESERDEAREAAAKWESSFDAMERAGAEQARRADENREWALRAERERDEAWACCDELVVDSDAISLAKTVMRLEQECNKAKEDLDRAQAWLEEIFRNLGLPFGDMGALENYIHKNGELQETLQEIAEANSFDNIGNWARNKARNALETIK